jgi:rare lipoprotein A
MGRTPAVPPVTDPNEGVASWYGEEFHGKATAAGEVFDMNGLTAAHPELPLGSWVEITNLRNGRSVVVRINDRGPSIEGRMLDVSKATAQALGFVGAGIAKVRIRVVPRPRPSHASKGRASIVPASVQPSPKVDLIRD